MAGIMRNMNHITRCQAIYRAERLSELGLTGAHASFILAIARMPGVSQEALARDLCLNKSTVTRTLAYFEECDYVTRRPSSEDKRAMHVYPTAKMMKILPRVREVTREWSDLLSEGIDEGELSLFLSVITKMESRARELVGREEGER